MQETFLSQLSKEHVLRLLEKQGISVSEFRAKYWAGSNSHATLDYFNRASGITLPNLIRMCDILNLTPNEILLKSDKEISNLKRLGGSLTTSLSADLMSLENELSQEKIRSEALRDKIIYLENSLREKQDLINFFTKVGQKSDK